MCEDEQHSEKCEEKNRKKDKKGRENRARDKKRAVEETQVIVASSS